MLKIRTDNAAIMRYFIPFLLCIIQQVSAQTSPAYRDSVFTEYFRRTSGWTASDGTISVALPEGKSLWLMGDSYIDNFNVADTTIPCLFQVRNSIMVQNILVPTEFKTILDYSQTGVNRTPVKAQLNDNTYFWPGHGFAKQDSAITFWQQYTGADYTHIGNYVARIYTPDIEDASAIKKLKKLDLPNTVEFGTAVVVDSATNYIYLYGMKPDWIIFRPLVARVSLNKDVGSVSAWEFFNGTGWSSDVNAATQLMGDPSHYVSPSYSVIKLQEKYYMISQDIGFLTCGLGREINLWESTSPQGPFTNKKLLYTIEDKYRGEYMITYNATAHPEFIKNNELLISYNVNGACTSYCENAFVDRYNADLYRPKFIRVPLHYIDPGLNVPDPVFPKDFPITGTEKNMNEENMHLYPNPATGRVTIVVDKVPPAATATVSIKSNSGAEIIRMETKDRSIQVNLDPGFYIVKFSYGKQGLTRKLIVH